MAQSFVARSRIEAPAAEAFRWHARPGAFERLAPPWDRVEVVERRGGLEDGARVSLRLRAGPLRVAWVAEHRDFREGRSFRDVQRNGPFSRWEHTHSFEPEGTEACQLEDRIEYELPGGLVGQALAGGAVGRRLERTFRYRHAVTAGDLAVHAPCRGGKALKVAVTGSHGLVGSALVPFLTAGGHEVVRLVRQGGEPAWDAAAIGGADAVVHLAGESIAEGRWTAAKKQRIRDSRVGPTRHLAEGLARVPRRPSVLVCASAIGYYGDRGDEVLAEESGAGSGFLPDVCREWEAASQAAEAAGIRVVRLRLGIVLSPAGGALATMLTPFRLGVGGRLGSGRQWVSWIGIDDALGAIHHALVCPELWGPVNAVAPEPVTNASLTACLGRVLGRPTLAAMPRPAARLLFGEMADALLLASTRVSPRRLLASGYRFRHSELEPALRHVLGR